MKKNLWKLFGDFVFMGVLVNWGDQSEQFVHFVFPLNNLF